MKKTITRAEYKRLRTLFRQVDGLHQRLLDIHEEVVRITGDPHPDDGHSADAVFAYGVTDVAGLLKALELGVEPGPRRGRRGKAGAR